MGEAPLNIFLGYDPREHEPYLVARGSIEDRSSRPVLITPLAIRNLSPVYSREHTVIDGKLWCPISQAHMSTEFANSRFSVPLLCSEGWVLFADSDIVCTGDISELFDLADDRYAIMVVKHRQISGREVKMDGQVQQYYRRKNWSSVMLMNCSHPSNQRLADILNTARGRDLHAFCWLHDEDVGELPGEWNFLVGINSGPAKLFHFTNGGPWFKGWRGGEMDDLWTRERDRVLSMRREAACS